MGESSFEDLFPNMVGGFRVGRGEEGIEDRGENVQMKTYFRTWWGGGLRVGRGEGGIEDRGKNYKQLTDKRRHWNQQGQQKQKKL